MNKYQLCGWIGGLSGFAAGMMNNHTAEFTAGAIALGIAIGLGIALLCDIVVHS